jgi:hypothetical protein
VSPADNALQTADQLGRPVAILRIGSRVPANLNGDLTDFLYGSPPWIPLITTPNRQALVESGEWSEVEMRAPTTIPYSEPPTEDTTRIPAGAW